jgi:hypothetical protein
MYICSFAAAARGSRSAYTVNLGAVLDDIFVTFAISH